MSTETAVEHDPDVDLATTGLSERDIEILDLERCWWKYPGAKETVIREKFAMSATRYYQIVNAIIDRPAALEVDPFTVRRLQRIRTERQHQRSARHRGFEMV